MGEAAGSGFVQKNPPLSAWCNTWVPPSYPSVDPGRGEVTDEGVTGGGGGEKGRTVGERSTSTIPCLNAGVDFLDKVRGGGVKPLLGGAGGASLDPRRGVRSAGKGGGVGGTGEAAREGPGVDVEGSRVRESHSPVTAWSCRVLNMVLGEWWWLRRGEGGGGVQKGSGRKNEKEGKERET